MNITMSPELHSPTVTYLNTANKCNKKMKKYTFKCLTSHQMSILMNKTIQSSYPEAYGINIPSHFKEGSLFVTFHRISSVTRVKRQKKESGSWIIRHRCLTNWARMR